MKKLLASLLAMSMVFAFTACSLTGDDDDDSSSKKSKDSSSSSVVDDSDSDSKDEDSSKADGESSVADDASSEADESTTDDSSEAEPVDDSSEADAPVDNTNDSDKDYTIEVDTSVWTDITNTVSGVDVAYSYVGDSSNQYLATANFNIIQQGGAGTAKVADYIDLIKQQYESLGYKISNSEEITFNGYKAYKVETSVEQSGMTMTMNQIVLIENSKLFVISYGSESSVFDTVKPEFQKVLDTFKVN